MSGLLTLPRLGETMQEGRVVAWLVEEGAAFARGDAIVEVETDKTVVEVPALGAGVLAEHLVAEGEAVEVGMPLARLLIEGPDWTAEGAPPEERPQSDDDDRPKPEAVAPPGKADASDRPADTGAPPQRTRATPAARKRARHAGIDIATVVGSGRRGRVEARDIASVAPVARPPEGGIHLRREGPDTGVPVVLLHGFAADGSAWAGLSARLARAGRHAMAPDLPGHGATGRNAHTPQDLAAGLHAALAPHTGQAPVHIVAHSLGAIPALDLAADLPVGSVTLIAPVGLSYGIDRAFVLGLAHAQSPAEVEHLLGRMVEGPLPLSPEALTAIHGGLASGRLGALAETLVGARGQAVNLRRALAKLAERVPVRLILGHRDRIVPWEDALGVSARIAIHHIPGAGHMPHWEALPEICAIVEQAIGPT